MVTAAATIMIGVFAAFLLGDRAWKLPRRLDRVVPEIDVEGERLASAGS